MTDTAILNLPEAATPAKKAGKPAKKAKGKKTKPAPVPVNTRGVPQEANAVRVEGVKRASKELVKKAVSFTTSDVNGAARGTIHGFSITSAVRAVGAAGANVAGVCRMLTRLGIPSHMGMVRAQTGDGHRIAAGLEGHHGKAAKLTKAQLAELLKLCAE